jgi:hypothetical protein
MRRYLPALLFGLAAAALAWPSTAREITPAEKRVIPYVADIPLCGDPSVLAKVTSQFADKEAQYWNSALRIVEYERIQPLSFKPWGLDYIPRRFCTATATVSNGRKHRVDYSVREDLDFIGNGWGVEFCVHGLDRNWAFAPACRMARP